MIALVVAAPIVVVVGVVKYAVLQRMWDLFTAALVNIVKFTIAAGAMTLILGAIYTAPVGMGWRLLFAIVATVVAIMITKPVASFKSMAGLDPTRSYLGPLLRRAGGTAVGVVAGQKLPATTSGATPALPGMTGESDDVPGAAGRTVDATATPADTAYVLQGSAASAGAIGRPALQSRSVAAAELRGLAPRPTRPDQPERAPGRKSWRRRR